PANGSDDEIVDAFIAPGDDGECQTAAEAGDAQGRLEVGRSITDPVSNPANELDPITSVDEWQFIGQRDKIGVPEAFGTPDEDRHVAEPTTEDLRASRERSRVADIALSAHASSGLGQGREVTLRFRAENL